MSCQPGPRPAPSWLTAFSASWWTRRPAPGLLFKGIPAP